MGVRGLKTLLHQTGLLPSSSSNDDDVIQFPPLTMPIPPESTLAMDGSSFMFHIYRLAYRDHYEQVMQKWREKGVFQNELHLINHLLPSMLPLDVVQSVTAQILHQLLNVHQVNLHVFYDGDGRRMKECTDKSRSARIDLEKENLRRFIVHHVLPKSFMVKDKMVIPEADVFIDEFPLPRLLFEQIKHTFDLTNQYFNEYTPSITFKLIKCDEEVDRFVAMASADDETGRTFAVGDDTDYCIFGYGDGKRGKTKYVPLEFLQIFDNNLQGAVLNRCDVAQALGLSGEGLLIEYAILLGNDYTSHFTLDSTLNKSTNFFREHCTKQDKMTPFMIAEYLSHQSDYQVTSSHPDFQHAINFTRDLFNFRDIHQYPLDRVTDDSILSEEGEIFGSGEAIHTEIVEKLRTRLEYDFSLDNSIENLNSSISISIVDMSLKLMSSDTSKDGLILPPKLKWEHVHLSFKFQDICSKILRSRSKQGISVKFVDAPVYLFHPFAFQNCAHMVTEGVSYKDETRAGSLSFDDLINLPYYRCLPEGPEMNNDSLGKEETSERRSLPIDSYKSSILSSIKSHRVTVIQGETGCGKSSRLPVMIMEDLPPPDTGRKESKLFICQPRRIAAKSLFDRVRRTEPHLKHLFGLRMGHGVKENNTKGVKAWFSTTGYLVRLLAENPEWFHDFTHIIIDEVHERSVDTDILCLLARRLLSSHRSIRLVLMSATLASELYCRYFEVDRPPIFVGARCHPIDEFFIEDLAARCSFGARESRMLDQISQFANRCKCMFPPSSNYMNSLHCLTVATAVAVGTVGSSVLIFVPGINDIIAITEQFNSVTKPGIKFKCIPIHSDIPIEDQMEIFTTAGDGEIRVIIATNAAESSVTVPDVDHIIDTGLNKLITYNPKSHRQMLVPSWISKASATQRSGRTGRVRRGSVYRLYPRKLFEDYMPPFEEGEICRTPLDSVILSLRSIVRNESVTGLLSDCLEVPDIRNIEQSFESLHRSRFIDEPVDDFEITPLGSLVASLGIDLILGAMIGLGLQLGIAAEAIEMATILSFPKPPWLIPSPLLQDTVKYNDIASKTFVSKSHFDSGLYSESFAVMNLLWDYDHSQQHSNTFCKNNSISYTRLKNLIAIRNNLRSRVASTQGVNKQALVVTAPPRAMLHYKLVLLRVIQCWLFHDNLIKLKAPRKTDTLCSDNYYSVSIKGCSVLQEHHLNQILDKKRHPFEIECLRRTQIQGKYKPLEIDGVPFTLGHNDFEDRFLSLCIAKGFVIMMLFDQPHSLALYVLDSGSASEKSVKAILNLNPRHSETVLFYKENVSRRGWQERDCGTFKVRRKMTDRVDNEMQVLKKYSFESLGIGTMENTFRQARLLVQNKYSIEKFRALFLTTGSVAMDSYPYQILAYGKHNSISPTEISDLFATPDTTFREAVSLNGQKIIFSNISGMDRYKIYELGCTTDAQQLHCSRTVNIPLVNDIPEGARILYSIAHGYRKPVLRFPGSKVNEDDEMADIEFTITTPYHRTGKWIIAETGQMAIVDPFSLPASAVPLDLDGRELYGCAANFLETNGSVKVEGITLLPYGSVFFTVASRCMGLWSRFNVDSCFDDVLSEADLFNHTFSHIWEQDLSYSPDAVRFLCQIFGKIDEKNVDCDEKPPFFSIPFRRKDTSSPSIKQTKNNPVLKASENVGVKVFDGTGDVDKTETFFSIIKVKTKAKGKKRTRYRCDKCLSSPMKMGKLVQHLVECYKISVSCARNLTGFDQASLQVMKKNISPNKSQSSEQGRPKYRCLECDAKPFKWKKLTLHMQQFHHKNISLGEFQDKCRIIDEVSGKCTNNKQLLNMEVEVPLNDSQHFLDDAFDSSIENNEVVQGNVNVSCKGEFDLTESANYVRCMMEGTKTIGGLEGLSKIYAKVETEISTHLVSIDKTNVISKCDKFETNNHHPPSAVDIQDGAQCKEVNDATCETICSREEFPLPCERKESTINYPSKADEVSIQGHENLKPQSHVAYEVSDYVSDKCAQIRSTDHARSVRFHEPSKLIESEKHSKNDIKKSQSFLYRCVICDATNPFSKWDDLQQHVQSCHNLQLHTGRYLVETSRIMNKSYVKKVGLSKRPQKKAQLPANGCCYKCPVCNLHPMKWDRLKLHIQEKHNGENLFTDQAFQDTVFQNFCKIETDYSLTVKKEKLPRSKPKYKCPECGTKQNFSWKKLKQHMIDCHDKELLSEMQQKCKDIESFVDSIEPPQEKVTMVESSAVSIIQGEDVKLKSTCQSSSSLSSWIELDDTIHNVTECQELSDISSKKDHSPAILATVTSFESDFELMPYDNENQPSKDFSSNRLNEVDLMTDTDNIVIGEERNSSHEQILDERIFNFSSNKSSAKSFYEMMMEEREAAGNIDDI